MASTITLQNTINFTAGFLFNQPLALGAANEPAITIANVVKQAILGPPFSWRWNRTIQASFNLTTGVQDYPKAYGTFGFLEKAWLSWAGGATVKEIAEVVELLAAESVQGRPDQQIAAQLDDNAGNITFRVKPAPDAAATYALTIVQQNKATLFSALSGNWGPIPDEMSYLYQYGFLGLALAFKKDPRSQIYDARFVAHLPGAQSGLSEMQKNIFLDKWLATGLQIQTTAQRMQQGVQGRAQ